MQRNLIVLTGPMRSGTTFLADLLYAGYQKRARHPRLAFANDHLVSIRDISSEAAQLAEVPRPQMANDTAPDFENAWRALARERNIAESLFDAIRNDCPTPAMPEWMGFKNTCLLPEIPLLASLGLDRLKIIVMIRDPRDCFCSYAARHKRIYVEGDGYYDLAEHLAFMNAFFFVNYLRLKATNCLPSSDMMFVRYEDLGQAPRPTLEAILRFLGLDPDEYDWASIEKDVISNSSYLPTSDDEVISDAGIRPSIGNHDTMSRELRVLVENAMSPVFDEFGYERSVDRIAWWKRSVYEFLEKVEAVSATYGYSAGTLHSELNRHLAYRIGHAFWRSRETAAGMMQTVRAAVPFLPGRRP